MKQKNEVELEKQGPESVSSALEHVLRQGTQRLLQGAIAQEVAAYLVLKGQLVCVAVAVQGMGLPKP